MNTSATLPSASGHGSPPEHEDILERHQDVARKLRSGYLAATSLCGSWKQYGLSSRNEALALCERINPVNKKSEAATSSESKTLEVMDFYEVCPCTLNGHPCQNRACTRRKLCLVSRSLHPGPEYQPNSHQNSSHGVQCPKQVDHQIVPTCSDNLIAGECALGGACPHGHDFPEVRDLFLEGHQHHLH